MRLTDLLQSPQMGLAMRMLSAAGPTQQPLSFGQRLSSAVVGNQQAEMEKQLTLARIASLHRSSMPKQRKVTLPDRMKFLARKISQKKASKEEKYEFDLLARSSGGANLLTGPIFRELREDPLKNDKKRRPIIKTQAEYDALKEGDEYIDAKDMKPYKKK